MDISKIFLHEQALLAGSSSATVTANQTMGAAKPTAPVNPHVDVLCMVNLLCILGCREADKMMASAVVIRHALMGVAATTKETAVTALWLVGLMFVSAIVSVLDDCTTHDGNANHGR